MLQIACPHVKSKGVAAKAKRTVAVTELRVTQSITSGSKKKQTDKLKGVVAFNTHKQRICCTVEH